MAWLANNPWLIATVLLSCALAGLSLRYANWIGMVDTPSARRSHLHPTARGGGIAITLCMLLFLGLPVFAHSGSGIVILFCATLAAVSLIGWLDDHKPVAASIRFAVQLVAAATVVIFHGTVLNEASATQWAVLDLLIGLSVIMAICWNINLVNFMDGSNGLAAVNGLFCTAVWWWLLMGSGDAAGALVAAVAAASILGFLPWNWPFGRLFMGDAGSYAIGFILAFLSAHAILADLVSIWLVLLIQAVFLVDSTATLVYRVIRGEQWYTPHREHAYQRLLTMGMSHTRVLMIYSIINVFLILPVLVLINGHETRQAPVVVITLIGLLTGWWGVQRRWRQTQKSTHAERRD